MLCRVNPIKCCTFKTALSPHYAFRFNAASMRTDLQLLAEEQHKLTDAISSIGSEPRVTGTGEASVSIDAS